MTEDRNQSTFVTVVAWIFIVISGFGTVIAILQNVMVQTVFRDSGMAQAMQTPPPGTPPLSAFMAMHLPWVFFAFLLISTFTLISSVGLLKRRNWARLSFVGLMVLG